MNVTAIYGQNHKGSTYYIAHSLAKQLAQESGSPGSGTLTEFFLPRDFSPFCAGCSQCFEKGEERCPHHTALEPITQAIDAADVLILASPVYVYHVTAPMKNMLDHYGWRWMVHRPNPALFFKQAVCISTAAGAGMKSTNRDMADSLFFWGVPKIWRRGYAVAAVTWSGVSGKKKKLIEKDIARLAGKIRRVHGHTHAPLKTKAFFSVMRMLHKKGWNKVDYDWWEARGWHGKARPWKRQ